MITLAVKNSLTSYYLTHGEVDTWDGWLDEDLKREIYDLVPEFEVAETLFALGQQKHIHYMLEQGMKRFGKFDPVEQVIRE